MSVDRCGRRSAVLGETGYRLLMAGAATRLAGRGDRSSRALARALAGAALGRFPAEERAWLNRIVAHRELLPAQVMASSIDTRGLPGGRWRAEAEAATRWMSLPPVLGRLLMRIVRELAPGSCLELGTGFGLSAAYQAAALDLNDRGRLITLDVAGMIAIARPSLSSIGLAERVETVPGQIEETLAATVRRAAPIEYALLDADHTERGTLDGLDSIAPSLAPGAVVVLDDIAWTDEMRRAWRAARARPWVGSAIALRRLGILIAARDGERR